ncbi:carbohydrate ABC transporter permease [Paenibacillus lignilyticus]|uniref:Carbohydrate ABC transporter permease n=1 Tax=Paenibacillus lignilyticus TaxID=1172615 RepID=A0ABS5CIY8_9BACL|nr:carbohydrate ABC transporter permease [Paenibacillus lignilyticus]MBP3965840.1 carbohydrate ABC transporter permease [Paenibacillus lignilyticus]
MSAVSSIKTNRLFQTFNITFFSVISLVTLVPLLYVVAVSFTTDAEISASGYQLIPKQFSGLAYSYLLQTPKALLNAYFITILVTILGTLLSLLMTSTVSYVMTRRDYRYSNATSFYVFFTMLFNGGLVPTYLVVTKVLHIQDTLWVLFLPYAVSPMFAMLMRGFLKEIPYEVIESGKVDGAGEFRIFASIVMPLAKPALATVGLFYALAYWNDWWLAMLYISNEKLIPLQFMLQRIMSNLQYLTSNMQAGLNIDMSQIPGESSRMAIALLAIGPMMFAFPLFQRHIVRGLTLGAVKG